MFSVRMWQSGEMWKESDLLSKDNYHRCNISSETKNHLFQMEKCSTYLLLEWDNNRNRSETKNYLLQKKKCSTHQSSEWNKNNTCPETKNHLFQMKIPVKMNIDFFVSKYVWCNIDMCRGYRKNSRRYTYNLLLYFCGSSMGAHIRMLF